MIVLAEKQLNTHRSERENKRALERLLKYSAAAALGQEETMHLDTNEVLPRFIPVLLAHFSPSELAELLGKRAADQLLEMYRTEMLQNLFLENELRRVLHAFHEAGIAIMLFKGPALAYTVYPQPHMRTYHDLDMLIRGEDMERASKMLTELGYTYYEEFRANVTNSKRTGYNFVLERADAWLEVLIELHTAPHESEIGMDFDVAALWANAQQITVLGEPTLTMHLVDHLLYLCWHYRFHSFSRLLWLYDVVVILRSAGDDFDWKMLVEKARQQKLASTMYYCLSWCRALFEVDVPEGVMQELKPPALCRLIIERLAVPDPLSALARQQEYNRRVLAHHVMVDHWGALLKVGLRTLFPAPATIGQRYMERSPLPLKLYFLYYFIHPWITLAKGLRYVLRTRGRSARSKS